MAWMETQAKAEKPFLRWYNSTAMHFRTHVAEKNLGKSGQDPYSDRMVVHDEQIGQMLSKLDELGIADKRSYQGKSESCRFCIAIAVTLRLSVINVMWSG